MLIYSVYLDNNAYFYGENVCVRVEMMQNSSAGRTAGYFQVLFYHFTLMGLLFNSSFQDGREDYMHECIGMLGTHGLKLLIFNPISFVHDSI